MNDTIDYTPATWLDEVAAEVTRVTAGPLFRGTVESIETKDPGIVVVRWKDRRVSRFMVRWTTGPDRGLHALRYHRGSYVLDPAELV